MSISIPTQSFEEIIPLEIITSPDFAILSSRSAHAPLRFCFLRRENSVPISRMSCSALVRASCEYALSFALSPAPSVPASRRSGAGGPPAGGTMGLRLAGMVAERSVIGASEKRMVLALPCTQRRALSRIVAQVHRRECRNLQTGPAGKSPMQPPG